METTTKIICAICAVIVLATITIHANSSGPAEPVLADEQGSYEPQLQDAPLSGGFSYNYDQTRLSKENGARYQQFAGEDLVGAPQPEPPLEDDLILDEQDEPGFLYIPPAQAGTEATVYPSDDDPAMSILDMTDQQVLDQALSMMDANQRASFRATWLTMSPEERAQAIAQMRMGMAGA